MTLAGRSPSERRDDGHPGPVHQQETTMTTQHDDIARQIDEITRSLPGTRPGY